MYKKNYLFALACAAALVGCGEGNKDAEKKHEAEAPSAGIPAEPKAEAAPEANTPPAASAEKKEEPKAEPSAPATPENKEEEGKGKEQGA